MEAIRRKERNEAHLFLSVDVYFEDDFQGYQGSDLLDFEDVKPRCACVRAHVCVCVCVYPSEIVCMFTCLSVFELCL